jgi:hypothetical protein
MVGLLLILLHHEKLIKFGRLICAVENHVSLVILKILLKHKNLHGQFIKHILSKVKIFKCIPMVPDLLKLLSDGGLTP